MFWNRFLELCVESGKSPNGVAKELGIPSGSITAWKNGSIPRSATLIKIASHFNVPVSVLAGESDQKEKSPTPNGVELGEKRIQEMLGDMTVADLEALLSDVAVEIAKKRGSV